MKRVVLVALAISVIFIATIGTTHAMSIHAQAGNPNYGEFYPRLSIVIEIHRETIICQDKEGNLWAFFSYEDSWVVGDMCNLLMWNLSEDITEHEVVEVYWEGHVDNIESFLYFIEW